VPVSRLIGKRYTVIVSLAVFLACNIWSAVENDYHGLLASRVVGGLFGGVIESLGPPIIEELFERRELGTAMMVYVGSLAGGSSLGPLMAGYITSDAGDWRWFLWASSIMVAINLIGAIIMLPESAYSLAADTRPASLGNNKSSAKTSHNEEAKSSPALSETSQTEEPTWTQVYMRNSFFLRHPHIHRPKNWFALIFDPFRLVLVPSVLACSVVFGMHIAWAVVTSITVADYYGGPPNFWASSSLGLLQLAPTTGLFIGAFLGGPGADLLQKLAASRAIKRGTPSELRDEDGNIVEVFGEPEARLPITLLPALISPLGIYLTGYFMQRKSHWISVASAMAMGAAGITAACNVYLTYCVDSYKPYAAQLSVTINVFKNCLGFGVSYAGVPWENRVGYENLYGTMAGMLFFSYLLTVPNYLYGKKIRAWTYTWLKPADRHNR
jgi:predicted MFS family arabinose efflux permease